MLSSPIGRYQPGNSVIHKLDARVKIVCTVALVCLTLAVNSPAQLALALAVLAALCAAAGVAPKTLGKNLVFIVPFVVIVGVFNLFSGRSGTDLVVLGPLAISTGGTWVAVLYAARLLMAVALGALLLLTTTPTALTDAFESLLSPLAKLGLPAHELSMVLSLALRFVPVLADEAQSIRDAQVARGGSYEEGGFVNRARAAAAVIVPMTAGAIRHANNLSRALDARCYEGGKGRTHYHEQRLDKRDLLFALAIIAYAIALAALGALGI